MASRASVNDSLKTSFPSELYKAVVTIRAVDVKTINNKPNETGIGTRALWDNLVEEATDFLANKEGEGISHCDILGTAAALFKMPTTGLKMKQSDKSFANAQQGFTRLFASPDRRERSFELLHKMKKCILDLAFMTNQNGVILALGFFLPSSQAYPDEAWIPILDAECPPNRADPNLPARSAVLVCPEAREQFRNIGEERNWQTLDSHFIECDANCVIEPVVDSEGENATESESDAAEKKKKKKQVLAALKSKKDLAEKAQLRFAANPFLRRLNSAGVRSHHFIVTNPAKFFAARFSKTNVGEFTAKIVELIGDCCDPKGHLSCLKKREDIEFVADTEARIKLHTSDYRGCEHALAMATAFRLGAFAIVQAAIDEGLMVDSMTGVKRTMGLAVDHTTAKRVRDCASWNIPEDQLVPHLLGMQDKITELEKKLALRADHGEEQFSDEEGDDEEPPRGGGVTPELPVLADAMADEREDGEAEESDVDEESDDERTGDERF